MRDFKMKASQRREEILNILKERTEPITGSSLAERMDVTRQVIVGDVSLLKASGEPIIATSQGYVYMTESREQLPFKRTIVVQHTPEQTEEELNILVDHGVHVLDVLIEHPVYGDLKARLEIASRRDVRKFLERIASANAAYLLELTEGIHSHTIAAAKEEHLNEAVKDLKEKGILFES
ncbi:transcription repressor NadR [Halobacillus sp. Marseille-Q1614]|uniref:transcription repressor NadR n=1 Tax=Halobacillus sp. Marseille-Q1614 TaxID=2709134 RepID=UPI00156E9D8E|nr:transcription repressor NadR [Halobacillus sp. Marseille-Q1614]